MSSAFGTNETRKETLGACFGENEKNSPLSINSVAGHAKRLCLLSHRTKTGDAACLATWKLSHDEREAETTQDVHRLLLLRCPRKLQNLWLSVRTKTIAFT